MLIRCRLHPGRDPWALPAVVFATLQFAIGGVFHYLATTTGVPLISGEEVPLVLSAVAAALLSVLLQPSVRTLAEVFVFGYIFGMAGEVGGLVALIVQTNLGLTAQLPMAPRMMVGSILICVYGGAMVLLALVFNGIAFLAVVRVVDFRPEQCGDCGYEAAVSGYDSKLWMRSGRGGVLSGCH